MRRDTFSQSHGKIFSTFQSVSQWGKTKASIWQQIPILLFSRIDFHYKIYLDWNYWKESWSNFCAYRNITNRVNSIFSSLAVMEQRTALKNLKIDLSCVEVTIFLSFQILTINFKKEQFLHFFENIDFSKSISDRFVWCIRSRNQRPFLKTK